MKSRFVEIRLVRMSHPYGHVISDDVVVGHWEPAPCKSYITIANMRQVVHLNVPLGEFMSALQMTRKRSEHGALKLLAVIGAKTCIRPVV